MERRQDQMSSLKALAIKGTIWTLIGYGSSQVIRLGSNLVLTRLLFPEVFGLSALFSIFLIGLQMFSDIGIGPSIIQNDKGDDPIFLNTAWTIQVLRGIALWVCACLGAYPFALFYGQPELTYVIIVSGLTALISGFNSTGLFTANRHLDLKKLTLIEIAVQIISTITIIVWAWFSPTVWAIVIGGIIGALTKMLASHLFLSNIKHQFEWNSDALNSLLKFGRWIFLSTILGFLFSQVDRLIVGKLVTISELGVYSLAVMVIKVIEQLYQRFGSSILFPLYSKFKNLSINEFRAKVIKIRIIIMLITLPSLSLLTIFGQSLINILFDERYHDAGWMIQILAMGWIILFATTVGPCFLAFGDSFTMMKLQAIEVFLIIFFMLLGHNLYGIKGLVSGITVSRLFYYPFLAYSYKKYKLWILWLDLLGLSFSGILIFSLLLTQKI